MELQDRRLTKVLVSPQVGAEDYSCMSQLLPPLQTLALQHPDPLVQELASDLRAVIATHGAYRPHDLAAAGAGGPGGSSRNISQTPEPEPSQCPDSSSKSLSDWLLEACDPDVPTRALALRTLTQKVQRKDPEAVQAQERVLLVGSALLSSTSMDGFKLTVSFKVMFTVMF